MDYTIVIKYEMMVMFDGIKKGSRLVFQGAGLNVYVIGALDGMAFEQAANLTMNKAEELHISVRSIRTVKNARRSSFETKTKGMF